MKKMNRVIGAVLCAVLSIGCLGGCGGAKRDQQILSSGISMINEAKNLEMNAKSTGIYKLTLAGHMEKVKISSDMTLTQFQEPFQAKIDADSKYELIERAGAETADLEMEPGEVGETTEDKTQIYVQKEGNKYCVYWGDTYASDEKPVWFKMECDKKEEVVSAAGIGVSWYENLSTDISKYVKKEDKKEGDKTYLVYEYPLTGKELQDKVMPIRLSLSNSSDLSWTKSMEDSMNKLADHVKEVKLTLYFDRDTEMLARIEMPVTDIVSYIYNAMIKDMYEQMCKEYDSMEEDDSFAMDLLKEEKEEIKKMYQDIKFEAKDVNLVITYSKINSAEKIIVPVEALKTETIGSLNGFNDLELDDIEEADKKDKKEK